MKRQMKVAPVPYTSTSSLSSPSSRSESSFWASPFLRPPGIPLRPTPEVRRKSKVGRLHGSLASKSRILKWSFPLPVSLRTSVHGISHCYFQRG